MLRNLQRLQPRLYCNPAIHGWWSGDAAHIYNRPWLPAAYNLSSWKLHQLRGKVGRIDLEQDML